MWIENTQRVSDKASNNIWFSIVVTQRTCALLPTIVCERNSCIPFFCMWHSGCVLYVVCYVVVHRKSFSTQFTSVRFINWCICKWCILSHTHNTKINFSAYFHKALYRKRICATTFRPYIAIVCVMVRINTLLRKYFPGKNDCPLNISESHGHNNSSLLWDYSIW